MVSGDRPYLLLGLVSFAGILALSSFALWPVFLIQLGTSWGLSNSDIGWIGGAYFFGYLVATPILVGLTDRLDARLIFIGGCGFTALGCVLFASMARDFWSAALAWALVGCGLAGTYMPGLQILNARLADAVRVRAVPWYTACFGIGTGGSFALMGLMLAMADYQVAAYIAATAAGGAAVIVAVTVRPYQRPQTPPVARHPLDLRPAFRKPVAMGYIIAYGAHSFELFAYRTWCFALLVFLAGRSEVDTGVGAITTIVTLITVSGMFASLIGARLCLQFGRHRVIALVGVATAVASLITALSLVVALWVTVVALWLYNICIMLDSGSLTTGTVEAGDEHDRGALLAVHSMVGFGGGALGGPVIGYVLDHNGGSTSMDAWFYALLAMGAGSWLVFFVQRYFWQPAAGQVR